MFRHKKNGGCPRRVAFYAFGDQFGGDNQSWLFMAASTQEASTWTKLPSSKGCGKSLLLGRARCHIPYCCSASSLGFEVSLFVGRPVLIFFSPEQNQSTTCVMKHSHIKQMRVILKLTHISSAHVCFQLGQGAYAPAVLVKSGLESNMCPQGVPRRLGTQYESVYRPNLSLENLDPKDRFLIMVRVRPTYRMYMLLFGFTLSHW